MIFAHKKLDLSILMSRKSTVEDQDSNVGLVEGPFLQAQSVLSIFRRVIHCFDEGIWRNRWKGESGLSLFYLDLNLGKKKERNLPVFRYLCFLYEVISSKKYDLNRKLPNGSKVQYFL